MKRIINVDGKEVFLNVDSKLMHKLETVVIPGIRKKDKDRVIIVDGAEGGGKSLFAMQLAKILDPNFTIDNICFNPEEFKKKVLSANKFACIIFDEAFTGLSNRTTLSAVNKVLVELMMEMRQRNLFVIIVLPSFFMLDKYVSLFRAKDLYHIYLKNGRRGFWIYFNNNKKKMLYLLGHKFYDYSRPRSNFKGRFFNVYTVNEEEYRKRKGLALHDKVIEQPLTSRQEKWIRQRNGLIYLLNTKYKMSERDLLAECNRLGIDIKKSQIHNCISEFRSELNSTSK